jgi:hypothetical protein
MINGFDGIENFQQRFLRFLNTMFLAQISRFDAPQKFVP